jgi:hypothetical protein
VQVFAAFEDVPSADLVASKIAPALRRVSLSRYLADKVQCVVERIEARDLVDIRAVILARPRLRYVLETALAAQDALLIAERLLAWSDEAIREDLEGYVDVDPSDAITMRDELLAMLRAQEHEEPAGQARLAVDRDARRAAHAPEPEAAPGRVEVQQMSEAARANEARAAPEPPIGEHLVYERIVGQDRGEAGLDTEQKSSASFGREDGASWSSGNEL